MIRVHLARFTHCLLIGLVAGLFVLSPLSALSPDPATAKVTFTFDDGRSSVYTKAAGILQKYGLKGTVYVITGCVGMIKTPNTCQAADDMTYMTWDQIAAMQTTFGWEIGSHSVSHPYLTSKNASDGQPNLLTAARQEAEISQSKTVLASHGINAQSFASPYGDYSMETLRMIAKYYTSHRGFKDINDNTYPYNDRLLNNYPVQYPVTAADVTAKIDAAIAKKSWLVLTFHDVVDTPSTNLDDYQWSTANFEAVAAYVKQKVAAGTLTHTNVSGGILTGTSNLLPPVVVSKKVGNGWTTDTAGTTVFTPSSSYSRATSTADSASSLRIAGASTAGHLFSPKVTVSSGQVYVLKSYLSVTSVTTGEIGYYIDEYDSSGTWISGQYKIRETTAYVENINLTYQPTSVAVKTARLQVYVTAGSTLKGTIDAFQWFVVGGAAATETNLLVGGGFETGLGSWTTDDAVAVKADGAGYGSGASPGSSVAFSKSTGTAHLFSPATSVTTGQTYHLEYYLNITANSGGVVGAYIDEYDAAGNWISGQYKATSSTLGGRTVQIDYTPSSAAVAKASQQFIVKAGTGVLSGYVDDVSWIRR